MKKSGHHSGFLYCPASEKILLQKSSTDPSAHWTLLENPNSDNFQKTVADLLKINLNPKDIFEVYDYSVDGITHFISYAEVRDLKDFPKHKGRVFAWFMFAEINKLPLSVQTKQDIIVGKRVIDSATRKKAGQLTIG